MNTGKEYINIHLLIKSSESAFLKRLPGFVVGLIKIIIRQDEINRILNAYSEYEGVNFLSKIIEEFNIKVKVEGAENLPENGKCFFVANHPFGFVDGLILTHTVAGKYGNLRAIGNEVFALIPHLRPIITPVNVFGINSREHIVNLEKLFASDIPITHFPAGMVSRVARGKIEDCDWQKGFIKKAIAYQRDVVPFYFCGGNSYLFYFVYIARKTLGIKTNLELALLPYEIFNKRNSTIKVKIGKPIPHQVFNRGKSHHEWAQFVKSQVYGLKQVPCKN